MITALFASTIVTAQSQAPATDFIDMLNHLPMLNGEMPRIQISKARVQFAPPGEFTASTAIESNGKPYADYPLSFGSRMGTTLYLSFKSPTFADLGIEEGTRKMTVTLNGKTISSFEFSLTKTTSGDAYNPKTLWIAKGPWQTHSYLSYRTDSGNQQRIQYTYFMSTSEIGPERTYPVEVTMRRGTTILAKSSSSAIVVGSDISRNRAPLYKLDRQPLMAPDLANMAGPFVLEVKYGSKLLRSFRGEIISGKFKPHPRSTLNYTDPTKFLCERSIAGDEVITSLHTWLTND